MLGFLRRVTLYPRILMAFVLVITPLYALGMLMNHGGKEDVKEELARSLETRVDFFMGTMEQEMNGLLKLQKEYLQDQDLRHFAFVSETMSQYEWSQTVYRIHNKLQIIKNSSNYIENVSAHIQTVGRTISSKDFISSGLQPEYEALNAAALDPGKNGQVISYWDGRFFLRIPFPDGTDERPPAYVLDVELSAVALEASLSRFTNYEDAGAMLVNPVHGWSIHRMTDVEIVRQALSLLPVPERNGGGSRGLLPVRSGGDRYLMAYQYSSLLRTYLVVMVPEEQVLGKLNAYTRWFWVLSVLSFAIVSIFSFWIFRSIIRPLNKLVRSFRKVEQGNMEPVPMTVKKDEFHYLYEQFNIMVTKLKVLIEQVTEQKVRAKQSELKQLQSQINPHFLYNTYFIFNKMAKINDMDNVVLFSNYLGRYFQYISHNDKDEVALHKEYEHMKNYVEIQNLRFYNRIQTDIEEIPGQWREVTVPWLILQPIVENAFKYALEHKKRDGMLRISFVEEAGGLQIVFEDNGEQLRDEDLLRIRRYVLSSLEESDSTGLRNVHRRLQLKYGEDSGIRVDRSGLGGLEITVYIKGKDGIGYVPAVSGG